MRNLFIFLAVISVIAKSVSIASCAESTPKKLTYLERREVTKLGATLKSKKFTPEEQDKAFDRLLEIGGQAIQKAFVIVGADLQRQCLSYEADFKQQAAAQLKEQTTGVDYNAIKALQGKVNALREKENLSKEEIISVADPIMAKLFSLFLVKAETILTASPELAAQRESLIQSSDKWTRCKLAMAEEYAAAHPNAPPVNPPSIEDYIQSREKLAALLAMPMSSENRAIITKNVKLAANLSHEEANGILACNLYRNLLGLNMVEIDLKLCAAARDHSKDMAEKKFFAHESPVAGKTRFSDRAKNFGTTASSENIYMGRTRGEDANRAWFHSPGHHKNMLGGHRRIGMGNHDRHWTEMFGR